MICYIDTSALIAVLDVDDEHFPRAEKKWKELIQNNSTLICSNYILVETIALVQNRLGIEALRVLQEDVIPVLTIEWISEANHQSGISNVISAGKRNISLVDYVSFDVMRRLGIKTAFTFDKHFKEQGFSCIP